MLMRWVGRETVRIWRGEGLGSLEDGSDEVDGVFKSAAKSEVVLVVKAASSRSELCGMGLVVWAEEGASSVRPAPTA